jgi:hypothetical protein
LVCQPRGAILSCQEGRDAQLPDIKLYVQDRRDWVFSWRAAASSSPDRAHPESRAPELLALLILFRLLWLNAVQRPLFFHNNYFPSFITTTSRRVGVIIMRQTPENHFSSFVGE